MKKNIFSLCLLAIVVTFFSACQKIEPGEKNVEVSSAEGFTVQTSMTQDDVWTINMPALQSKAGTEIDTCYMYYVFKSDGSALCNIGSIVNTSNIKHSYPSIFTQIKSLGTYTVYGILNISKKEFVSVAETPGMTTSQTFTLTEPRDICLGSQQLVISANKLSYSVSVTVSHIMAKLALTIKNVPSNISSLKVSLPNESNIFNLKGEFSGEQSQTLTVVKASTANSDGTYDWNVLRGTDTEEIVYPCIFSSMPITIEASDNVKTFTFSTSSSVVCASGTRTSLSATWTTVISTDAGMKESPWTGTQQAGTVDMGTPTIK